MKRKFFNLIQYLHKAWQTSRSYLLFTIIRNIFSAMVSLIGVVGLGIVINSIVEKKTRSEIILTIVIYLSVNLIITLIKHFLTLIENKAMRKASNELQYRYMNDNVNIDYHYVQDGNMLNLKMKSMLAHPAFSIDSFGSAINCFIQLTGLIYIFLSFSPLFVVILLIISFVRIFIINHAQKCEFNFNLENVENERKLNYLYEVMTQYHYAKEIRINNAKWFIKNKYYEFLTQYISTFTRLLKKKLGLNYIDVLFTCIQSLIVYIYFIYHVSVGGLNIADYIVALSATTTFLDAFCSFFRSLGSINNALNAIDIYSEYEDILKNNTSLCSSNSLPNTDIDYSNATIRFENVSFRYPNSSTDILQNLSFEVSCRKKIGIVGLNGSGKTTLIKLILRLYQPINGKITLNGIDISKIPYDQYSKHIGVVLQDFSLFSYSIKENIIFDKTIDLNRCFDCIRKSGLGDKISMLPNGIETSVYKDLDDNGIEFSGGEAQKLAIARSIYKVPDIYILDEPSSAQDAIAEHKLFSQLNDLSDNKTTIFISHRLSSTKFCDDILVLHKGTIIEHGQHEKLLNQNGYYADLYRSQQKYYDDTMEVKNENTYKES